MSFLNVNIYINIFIIIQDSFGTPDKNDNKKKNTIKNEQEEEFSNDEITNYTSSIINFKLKTNLSILITILDNNLQKQKLEIFNHIKNFNKSINNNINNISSENINEQLKKYLIFHNIQKNCNNILKIYNLFCLKKKSKFFSDWKNKILIEKAKSKIENEIKEKYNKQYKNQISNINSSIKKNEKSIEEIKSQEKKINQNIKLKEKQKEEAKKKSTELEQKIEEMKNVIEKLEKEKAEKENLTNSNNTFSSMSRKEVSEEIIKELENKVIELDNEKNERDTYFQNFYDEMINMMVIFEQKTQKIIKMQNYSEHPQKKLEINTGNEIYETNIRSKSKNKINSGNMGSNSTHGKKGNDKNREIFINYTDNFRNKIQIINHFKLIIYLFLFYF